MYSSSCLCCRCIAPEGRELSRSTACKDLLDTVSTLILSAFAACSRVYTSSRSRKMKNESTTQKTLPLLREREAFSFFKKKERKKKKILPAKPNCLVVSNLSKNRRDLLGLRLLRQFQWILRFLNCFHRVAVDKHYLHFSPYLQFKTHTTFT